MEQPISDFAMHLQGSGNGPKRIPVSQQAQKSVVTPTPHQRVLGLSNGPQRIHRPVSHQKPVAHVPAVKSTNNSDQNVNPDARKGNPALQSKHYSTETHPKTNVPKLNPEPARQTSESAAQETPQSTSCTLSKLATSWM